MCCEPKERSPTETSTPKMASCDIQVVNPGLLNRIESYMADASYREAIENSANYNTRLCIERRLRMPFLDSQTGVAQNHSNLFMNPRERIPGILYGQVYTYPSKRWRKKRRQYLMQPQVGMRRCDLPSENIDLHTISTVENPAAAASEDSKDSASNKDETSAKVSQDAWYYDELELQAMEGFEDLDPDSDYDYEESYSKKRRKRGGGKQPGGRSSIVATDSPHPKKGGKGTGVGRGRKKGVNYAELTDSEKPFSCDICGARYKTRPGLTYHYTHSHKDGATGTSGSGRSGGGPPVTPPSGPPPPSSQPDDDQGPPGLDLPPPGPGSPLTLPTQSWPPFPQPVQDGYLNYINTPGQ